MPSRLPRLPPGGRSVCPVANALDVVGDRWTLLVVRDVLLFGKFRYGELARSLEKIPTNILADRLRRLEKAGILRRNAYQRHPPRYEYRLTDRGADLFPILREMAAWANRHVRGTAKTPPASSDAGNEHPRGVRKRTPGSRSRPGS